MALLNQIDEVVEALLGQALIKLIRSQHAGRDAELALIKARSERSAWSCSMEHQARATVPARELGTQDIRTTVCDPLAGRRQPRDPSCQPAGIRGLEGILAAAFSFVPIPTVIYGIPQVASRSKWHRLEALQRNRAFIEDYIRARDAWREGNPVAFRPGTYWLRRFASVVVAET